jgi:hypothetical protein
MHHPLTGAHQPCAESCHSRCHACHLSFLQDEERLKTAVNEAPSLAFFNRKLARSDAEFVRFQEMDKDRGAWPGELMALHEVRRHAMYRDLAGTEVQCAQLVDEAACV